MAAKRTSRAEALLREYLADSDFEPGTRLPTHAELAEILGVGARPLREALTVLRSQGLVETRGRGGTVVSRPSEEQITEPIKWFFEVTDATDSDLIHTRAAIESALVVEACQQRTEQDLLMLQQWIERQAEPGISRAEEIEYDKGFHLALMSATHNKVMMVFAQLILLQFNVLYEHNLYPDQDKIRVQDHTEILAAVHGRDGERASRLTRTHVLRSLKVREARRAAGAPDRPRTKP